MNEIDVTPAEAKEVWDSLEEPSSRKVAAKFTAAGRPITFSTIAKWKRNGWPGTTAEEIAKAVAAALAQIDSAAPALTGDAKSTMADLVAARAEETNDASPDTRSNVERAEDSLREAMADATAVWASIRDIAIVRPKKDDAAGKNAPSMRLLEAPEGFAKLMLAASAAINMAIDGFRKVSALRIDEAAAVPGAQTVYPPGHGPYAERSHAEGFHGERGCPSRSAIEAVDQALKNYREGKP